MSGDFLQRRHARLDYRTTGKIRVNHVDARAGLEGLPEGVCAIARIDAKDDQGLEEAEESWELRDAGFDAVWLADVGGGAFFRGAR